MKEELIRPAGIFSKYRELAKADCMLYFGDKENNVNITCFSCSSKLEHSFNKENFSYATCPICDNILVHPRPEYTQFEKYYSDSESTKYWATTFYKETEKSRKELLWTPKAKLIRSLIEKDEKHFQLVDIGSGYGTFLDVFDSKYITQKVAIEPSVHLKAVLERKGYSVIHQMIEDVTRKDIGNRRTLFTCFELFEHLHDPRSFVRFAQNVMKTGDKFIFTTLNGNGLDIKLLGESSHSISPPYHLNFMNPISLKLMFKSPDLNIRVFTPGKLDLDILKKQLNDTTLSEEVKEFLNSLSNDNTRYLQELISEVGVSSHMWAVLEKL